MEFSTPSVEGHTRPAVIAPKLPAMAPCPVPSARNPAKSALIIQNVARYVISLAQHVLTFAPGIVHIANGARYYGKWPVICDHAHWAVQRPWLVGINVPKFVWSVQMLRIVKFLRPLQSLVWLLTLFIIHFRGTISMRILASCHHVDPFPP